MVNFFTYTFTLPTKHRKTQYTLSFTLSLYQPNTVKHNIFSLLQFTFSILILRLTTCDILQRNKQARRRKRRKEEQLKRERASSRHVLLMFDCRRKEEGREGKIKKKEKTPTTGSLSPLPYLYLILILELRCFFWQSLRERYLFLFRQIRCQLDKESSLPPTNQ